MVDWKNSEVLITGGTGTLGKALTKKLLTDYKPKGLRLFSRDEYKQWVFKNELDLGGYKDAPVAFLLGDMRDSDRIDRATQGVDIIFHTAAMKQIPSCEDHPQEAIKTNIMGAINLIEAAINNDVNVMMNVSTDKAAYPINLYGMTKGVAEKVFLHGNIYSGGRLRSSCCRYGNVLNSRGSVIPLFKEQYKKDGKITITHKDMTRFFIRIEDVVQFIIRNIERTTGNEVFIPKMRSAFIQDIAELIAPKEDIIDVGIRKGEKLHECLLTIEESKCVEDYAGMYVLSSTKKEKSIDEITMGYYSNDNSYWWSKEKLQKIINENYFV